LNSTEKKHPRFSLKDVTEIIIGAVLLAFPVAVTEEVWVISAELSLGRTVFISLCSMGFIAIFGYSMFYHSSLKGQWGDFLKRIFAVYLITLFVAALILAAINKFPWLTEPIVTLKRVIIVALPASFSATVVDSLK
jgi:uncharacterized membrane protein